MTRTTTGAFGHPYRAIPGPSVMPERVLRAMHRGAPDIYKGELHDLVARLCDDLRAVAQTGGGVAMYIGNGHAAWEASAANLFVRGDRVLVPAAGLFGLTWAGHLRGMGVEAEVIASARGLPVDPGQVEAALRADGEGRIRAVMATHVDTATSLRTDLAALRAAIDAAGHPALLVADCIASLACDEFRMDAWGVDVALAASQKGLMTPPGMCFLWVGERAREAGRRPGGGAGQGAGLRTPHWAWEPRIEGAEFSQRFNGTAPTHHLYGLAEALEMILREEGLARVWARHERLAGMVWAAFEAWGQGHPQIAMLVGDPAHRGRSVTAAQLDDGARLRAWLEQEAGVTLGVGLGMASAADPQASGFLRVAHMGHVNTHMTLGVLAAMEAGMTALSIPHGPGALDAAARAAGR
jgi:alanine-glyoxylate transaminase/serine-glyoxylate transaminase/serine-pyruvate transaminase